MSIRCALCFRPTRMSARTSWRLLGWTRCLVVMQERSCASGHVWQPIARTLALFWSSGAGKTPIGGRRSHQRPREQIHPPTRIDSRRRPLCMHALAALGTRATQGASALGSAATPSGEIRRVVGSLQPPARSGVAGTERRSAPLRACCFGYFDLWKAPRPRWAPRYCAPFAGPPVGGDRAVAAP